MKQLLFALAVLAAPAPALAQSPPSPTQIAAYTGLHAAAHADDAQRVHDLASAGADLNARDSNGRTPAHVAAFASSDDALRALAEAGADMNALEHGLYDVVTIAAVLNDPDLMSLAIELGNDPGLTTSIYDGTALIAAAHLGHAEVVRRLIAAGAPLDHVNNLHWTAAIEAVVLGDGGPDHQAALRALVEAGADITLSDRKGLTPLNLARQRGYAEMVEILTSANR